MRGRVLVEAGTQPQLQGLAVVQVLAKGGQLEQMVAAPPLTTSWTLLLLRHLK